MKYTENYGFDKPEGTDFVDVEHFNTNAELMDKLLCPEYSEVKEATELESGEKLATAVGKIAKAVKDIISHIKDTTIHFTAKEREKLNGIAEGANKYTHPTTSGNKHIPSGGSSGQILRWSADGTAVWGNENNTTYSNATTSAAGLMSASDKTKLNGIAAGANKTTIAANLTTTVAGSALDATMGKKLAEKIEFCSARFESCAANMETQVTVEIPSGYTVAGIMVYCNTYIPIAAHLRSVNDTEALVSLWNLTGTASSAGYIHLLLIKV